MSEKSSSSDLITALFLQPSLRIHADIEMSDDPEVYNVASHPTAGRGIGNSHRLKL